MKTTSSCGIVQTADHNDSYLLLFGNIYHNELFIVIWKYSNFSIIRENAVTLVTTYCSSRHLWVLFIKAVLKIS